MPKALPWFSASAAIVAVDQLVKWIFLSKFVPGERLEVTGFFNLVLVFNKGAAFSFLADAPGWQTPVLAAVAIAASAVISVLILKNKNKNLLIQQLLFLQYF